MHRTESSHHVNDFQFIGSESHPLHAFKLTNVSYSQLGITDGQEEKKKDIENFLYY